jgi:hypothetical protein
VVRGENSSQLQVLGHLGALGTLTQMITFTLATDTGHAKRAGLHFDGGTGDLSHIIVRNGGQSGGGRIRGRSADQHGVGNHSPPAASIDSRVEVQSGHSATAILLTGNE